MNFWSFKAKPGGSWVRQRRRDTEKSLAILLS